MSFLLTEAGLVTQRKGLLLSGPEFKLHIVYAVLDCLAAACSQLSEISGKDQPASELRKPRRYTLT